MVAAAATYTITDNMQHTRYYATYTGYLDDFNKQRRANIQRLNQTSSFCVLVHLCSARHAHTCTRRHEGKGEAPVRQ
jgi:hypothetical protein